MANPLDRMLAREFGPMLTSHGFRTTGRTYRLGGKREAQGILTIQAGSGSALGTTIFYVNLALLPKVWYDFAGWYSGQALGPDPAEVEGVLRNRLLAPVDVAALAPGQRLTSPSEQWTFTGDEQGEHCGRRLTMLVERDVVPLLDELRDPDTLVDFLFRPEPERGPLRRILPIRPLLVAVLLADSGPSDRLGDAIGRLRAMPDGARTLEWVEQRMSAS